MLQLGSNVCFNYGQTGHFRRDCPQLMSGSEVEQRVISQTISQLKLEVIGGEGSGGVKQKGPARRPRS